MPTQPTLTDINAQNSRGNRPTYVTPDVDFQPNITLERETLPIAIQHGMELWWDGSTPTKRLDTRSGSSKFTRFVNARIEGKLAEVAFSKLLEQYFECQSAVDWRIYGEYTETDDGDLQHLINATVEDNGNTRYDEYPLGVGVEIKKTKPWNSWLAVREEIFDRIDDDAPIVLAKLRIEDDIQLDEWEDANDWDNVDGNGMFRERLLEFADNTFPLNVQFVGAVYKDEFTDYFEKGDHLYDPKNGRELGSGLKRPNHGIHVDNIKRSPLRWNRVVGDIVSEAPTEIWRPMCVVDKR